MKPFLALCDCGAETLLVDLQFIEDEDQQGYFTFSTWWAQNQPWMYRLRLAWLALRGKEYYFSSVSMDREDLERLHDYMALLLQRQIHVDFTGQADTA